MVLSDELLNTSHTLTVRVCVPSSKFEKGYSIFQFPEIDFEICCSKGTYIRSLARDIGIALGTVAYLSDLRRTEIGELSAEDALDIAMIEQALSEQNLLAIPKVFSQ